MAVAGGGGEQQSELRTSGEETLPHKAVMGQRVRTTGGATRRDKHVDSANHTASMPQYRSQL